MNELLASEIAVGHCVILNDVEKPYGRLIAVIMEIQNDIAFCKYLCSDPQLDIYNKKRGMMIGITGGIHSMTPVAKFGVKVCFNKWQYWCEKVGESTATYRDGRPRQWQENVAYNYQYRLEVLKKARGEA